MEHGNGGPLDNQAIADVAAFVQTLKQRGAAPAPATAPTSGESPLSIPIVLICVGGLIVVGVGVLGLGLAGTRQRNKAQ